MNLEILTATSSRTGCEFDFDIFIISPSCVKAKVYHTDNFLLRKINSALSSGKVKTSVFVHLYQCNSSKYIFLYKASEMMILHRNFFSQQTFVRYRNSNVPLVIFEDF